MVNVWSTIHQVSSLMAMEEVVIAGIILLFKHPPSVTAAAEAAEEEETLSLSLSTHFKLKFFPNAAPRYDSFFRSFSVAAVCMKRFSGA